MDMKDKLHSITFFLILINSILNITRSGVISKIYCFLLVMYALIAAVELYMNRGNGKGVMFYLNWIGLVLALALIAVYVHNVFFV